MNDEQRAAGKIVAWLRGKKPEFYILISIVILAPLSALSIYRGFVVSRQFLFDFETFHIAARLLHDGENPYRVWSETPELLDDYIDPRGPENGVYIITLPFYNLPVFPVLLYPLGLLNHNDAETIWFVLQIMMAVAIPIITMHTFDEKPKVLLIVMLALLLLAWFPTRFTLKVSQASLFAILCAVLALFFDKKDQPVWAGICLGLALTKYTLTGPLIVYFIVYRRFRVLIYAFLVNLAGLIAVSMMVHESIFEIIVSYRNVLMAGSFGNSFPGAASLDGWLQLLGMRSRAAALTGLLLGIIIGVSLILPRYWRDLLNRNMDMPPEYGRLRQHILVLLLVTIGLFFLYHRGYDYPFMILFVGFTASQGLSGVLAEDDPRLLQVLRISGLCAALVLLVPESVVEGILVPPAMTIAAEGMQIYVPRTVGAIPDAISALLASGVLMWALYRIDRRRADVERPGDQIRAVA